MAAAVGGRVRADVREQVVDHLAEAFRVARDRDHGRRLERQRPGGLHRMRGVDRLAGERRQIDRPRLERASLVEPREQQQVADEQAHAPRLALDPGHRALEIVRAVARAAIEQLGVGAHGGDGRAQLVRGVRDEPAQARLRRRALGEGVLDLPEHRVERAAEPADLGRPAVGLDAPREVAGADRGRRLLDAPQRSQARGDQPEPEHQAAAITAHGDEQLDPPELVERRVRLLRAARPGSASPLRNGDGAREQAEARAALCPR